MIELPIAHRLHADTSPAAAAFLRLMADPTRRRIFLRLMEGETCNCELVDFLGLPQNLISHHLRQLRRSGLIRARRDEHDQRWIYYAVDREVLARVHQEIMLAFDPLRLGERTPACDSASGATGASG